MHKSENPKWLKDPEIQELLQNDAPKIDAEVDLQELFSACHQELTEQQRKRDQLIAFYLTLAGILISVAFADFATTAYKIWIFAFLALLGFGWTVVTLRYRVYKEVYWITCRTISALYTVERDKISKELIQAIFYRTMEKRVRGRLKRDKRTNELVSDAKGRKKWSAWRLFKAHFMSAEKIMYTTMALIACVLCGLFFGYCLPYYAGLAVSSSAIIGAVIGVVLYFFFSWLYYYKMCHLYDVVISPSERALNKPYEMAWFLHIYVGGTPKSDAAEPENKSDAA